MTEVRDIRRAARLSQSELAKRSGVSQPNIAAYEPLTRVPSDVMLLRISSAAPSRPSIVLDRFRAEILALATKHHARNVRVFGSISRGEDVSGSDIDLLVRFESDADIFDLADLTADLAELTGRHGAISCRSWKSLHGSSTVAKRRSTTTKRCG